MDLTQEMMDVYTLGATKEGVTDWTERDDRAGLQAVLNFLAPMPHDTERTSWELKLIRGVLGWTESAISKSAGYGGNGMFATADPEQLLIVRNLETVRDMLRPWARP